MENTKGIFKLVGKVQHYAWGGYTYIPNLLQLQPSDEKPYAEYWMGAHPGASAEVIINGELVPLTQMMQQDEQRVLGERVSKAFGGFPYLLKILDVRDMLSIQVHPTRQEAEKGFDAEEARGVPLDAPGRNYKDRNHKPEVMVALSDFWLLHGFRPEAQLLQVFNEVPELEFLRPVFTSGGYAGLYKKVMEMEQQEVDAVLKPLIEKILENKEGLGKSDPGYWAAKVFTSDERVEHIDRGIFSIYFFNIVHLKVGEAIFQAAGIPHAYLEGQNVELMANSDNVLRGGLTPKHIDVPELLKHVQFAATEPRVLRGERKEGGAIDYPCPVNDFGINAIQLPAGSEYSGNADSPEIFIIIHGNVTISNAGLEMTKGQSFLVLPGQHYTIAAHTDTLVYRAFVP